MQLQLGFQFFYERMIENVPKYARQLCTFLKPLEIYIYDVHPFDLFCEKGFTFIDETLETGWREWMENCPLDEFLHIMVEILIGDYKLIERLVPESFFNFIHGCQQLKMECPEIPITETEAEATFCGMGIKKLHEVKRLNELILDVATKENCSAVVDFGSGLGYLTHEIARNLPVVAVECDPHRTHAAKKRSGKLDRNHKELAACKEIAHVTEYLTLSNAENVFTNAVKNFNADSKFLLTGLHACGDLSARTMTDLFVNNSNIHALVSVGCCYNLMDAQCFPSSDLLRGIGFKIQNCGLKMAGHTFSSFSKERLIGLWRSQVIRAATKGRGRFKIREDICLVDNLREVLELFKMTPRPEVEEEDLLRCLKHVALIGTIRCSISPLLEAIILCDRLLALQALIPNCKLKAVFNPSLSPRNLALVAIKSES
jgi:hypothetical protein